MDISRIQVRWIILLCSICAYIVSLFLPALILENHAPELGGQLLARGWLGLLVDEFAWSANIVYILATLGYMTYTMSGRSIVKQANTIALAFSIGALILGATSYNAKTYYYYESQGTPIIGLGIGFYMWMLSFCILLIGCFIPFDPMPSNDGDVD